MPDAGRAALDRREISALPKATCLTLPLEKGQDVSLADWALNVTDDGPVLVVEELNANLSHVTGVAGAAKDLCHACQLDWLLL